MKKNTRRDLVNEYDAFVEENSISETSLIGVDLSSSEDESNDNSETQRQTSPATYDPSPASGSYNGFSTDQGYRCSIDNPMVLYALTYGPTSNIFKQHIYGRFTGTNDTTDVSRNNT